MQYDYIYAPNGVLMWAAFFLLELTRHLRSGTLRPLFQTHRARLFTSLPNMLRSRSSRELQPARLVTDLEQDIYNTQLRHHACLVLPIRLSGVSGKQLRSYAEAILFGNACDFGDLRPRLGSIFARHIASSISSARRLCHAASSRTSRRSAVRRKHAFPGRSWWCQRGYRDHRQ